MTLGFLAYFVSPIACLWARRQEQRILRRGVALDELQQEDARRAGVIYPDRVRLRIVDEVPPRLNPLLRWACRRFGMVDTVGMSLRYGIYIHADFWRDRSVLVHELVHTAQYERAGSMGRFLRQYLRECLTRGYERSELELEARRLSDQVCQQ